MKRSRCPAFSLFLKRVACVCGFGSIPVSAVTWQWDGGAGSGNWQAPANWDPDGVASFSGTFADRLNVNGAQTLVYSAAEGTTIYGTAGARGIVIGSGALGSGSMTITGGTFSTANANQADVIGNGVNNATLTINGGNFIGNSAGLDLGIGFGPTSILNIQSGTATAANIRLNSTTADINLTGGVLAANSISQLGGTGTINFNGGTLRGLATSTMFLTGLTQANVRNNGAIMDTNGFDLTVGQALQHSILGGDNAVDGGIVKTGSGTLFLTNTANTYTGVTRLDSGVLNVANLTDYGVAGSLGSRASGSDVSTNIGILFRGGTLQYTGSTAQSTNRAIRVSTTGGATIDASGSVPAATISFTATSSPDFFENGGARSVTFTGSNTGNNSFGMAITETGGATTVTKNGAGTWVLSGTNTYTGLTSINAGTLKNGSATTFTAKGPMALAGTSVFDLNGFNAVVTNVSSSINTSTITDNSAGAGTSTFGISAQGNTISSLIKNGPTRTVAVTLQNANSAVMPFASNSANTFSGGLTLLNSAGQTRLRITSAPVTVGAAGAITSSPFGTGPITIGLANTDRAGILLDIGANYTIANAIVFNTALGTDVPGIRLDTSGHTFSGTITANLSDAMFARGGGGTGSATLTGQVTGTNGLQLNASAVIITLNNATASPNDYNGNTTLGTGSTLHLGAANQIPDGVGKGSMTNGGTFNLNGFSETINGLTGSGIVDGVSGSPVLTIGFNTSGGTTFSGIIRNTAGSLAVRLQNNNSGNMPFAANSASTFSGGLTLLNSSGGTRLRITGAPVTVGTAGAITSSPFGTGPITIGQVATDKAGLLLDVGSNYTIANAIVFNTILGTDFPGIRLDSSGHTFSGTITANLSDALFSRGGGTGSASLTGRVTGTNGLQLNASPVSITLNNATASPNDYNGNTTLGTGSTLILGSANQIPNGTGKGNVVNNGTLNLNGFSETINGLSGNGSVTSASGTPVLTLGDNNTTATFGGIISGTLGLSKTGSGLQTLTNHNNYSGPTTVSAGELRIDGSIISNVTVSGTGTLSGIGNITGGMTFNAGSTFSPGNSPGVINHVGNLILNAGSTFLADVWNPTSDQVNLTGELTINDANLLAIWGGGTDNLFRGGLPSAQQMVWLVLNDDTDLITGTFLNDGVTVNTGLQGLFGPGTSPYLLSSGGATFAVFYDANHTGAGFGSVSGGNDLLLIAIPEPSRALLALLALLPLAWRRRRN